MGLAYGGSDATYNPKDIEVSYFYNVTQTGDRWFIPVNADTATKEDQLAQCVQLAPNGAEQVISTS